MLHVSKQRAKRSTMKSATSVSCCPLSVKVLWLVPVPLREATTCKQIKRCCLSRSQENTTASVWHQSSVPANWEIGLVSASPTCVESCRWMWKLPQSSRIPCSDTMYTAQCVFSRNISSSFVLLVFGLSHTFVFRVAVCFFPKFSFPDLQVKVLSYLISQKVDIILSYHESTLFPLLPWSFLSPPLPLISRLKGPSSCVLTPFISAALSSAGSWGKLCETRCWRWCRWRGWRRCWGIPARWQRCTETGRYSSSAVGLQHVSQEERQPADDEHTL